MKKDKLYEEIMKKAAAKCIDDGEYYDVDNGNPGFSFSAGGLTYMDDVGAVANKLCKMLSKEYVIEDDEDD